MPSIGQRDSEDQEPLHPGISTLSSASEFLEAQYLQYRSSWRSVRSVHRMQAFYVENQILNMLGIRGMTIDGITTSTLPNMADTQQVEVSGMQYENIFEVSSPFRINAIDAAYATTAQKIVNQTRSLASRNTSTSRTRARSRRALQIPHHPCSSMARPRCSRPATHPPA